MSTPDNSDDAIRDQIAYQIGNDNPDFGTFAFTYGDMQDSVGGITDQHPLEPYATMVMFHHLGQIIQHKADYFANMSAISMLDLQSMMTKMILEFMVECMDIRFEHKEN